MGQINKIFANKIYEEAMELEKCEKNPPTFSHPLDKGDSKNKAPLIKGGRGDFLKQLSSSEWYLRYLSFK